MEQLNGKTALITGAGKGLGKAVATALAAEGVNLALLSRTEADLIALATEINKSYPEVTVAYTTADVADFNSVTDAVSKLKAKIGNIDILINNGGISQRSLAKETTVDVDRKIMEVDYFGTLALTKTGGGTLTLSGANTFSGATTIAAGTLTLSGGSALADSCAIKPRTRPRAMRCWRCSARHRPMCWRSRPASC